MLNFSTNICKYVIKLTIQYRKVSISINDNYRKISLMYYLYEPNCFNLMSSIQVSVAGAQLQLKDLVCNASMLGQFLKVEGGEAAMKDLQTQLCSLPADVLQEAERLFLSQLDYTKFFTVGSSFLLQIHS